MMADIDNTADFKKDSNGRNIETVYCAYCSSKILNPGSATFINMNFSLPHMIRRRDEEAEKRELINDYWLVEEINSFENIGVSHKVENVKYLACADCERGPIGWHDLSTFRSYIALCRVKHQKSNC
ncbi:PREDICTED: guanine nucleotide exchange factor MSS4 homolog [Ceratosolen solmsi marchali]|uniref:Guanine nucleotide exchange factor MSS4 homolog n=1 Tax=Ceratosolen solmsi marchali TaxID=326594 RepID=A0AAJ6YNT6_9HYME|nr:PREDICTED: guanine nucleotide exchange factor MSS4 homolog [Ceratosolen solmsi marchali]XP_011501443.1 PREDICTED: guanine nucleotide exchange factor MSS4 homolog [Ceratosolen solmsi marchali]